MAIMISYSHNDWDSVKPVVCFLKENGLTIWLDRDEIQPSMDWRRELLRRPRQVQGFVPFISKNYIASEICRMELFLARSSERPIFPVMVEECWNLLDSTEETKYLAGVFAARLEALKLVGFHTTREVILDRLLRAIKNRLSTATTRDHNVYISYPNGAAEPAAELYSALSDGKIKPWIASMDCEIGDDWRKAQVQAMAKARVHLILITEDILNEKEVLRTEVLMSEALDLPTLCVMAPNLVSSEVGSTPQKNAGVADRVHMHVSNGEQAFRRLVKYQWYKPAHIEQKLRPDILKILSQGD
jgi:hypothetical protein